MAALLSELIALLLVAWFVPGVVHPWLSEKVFLVLDLLQRHWLAQN
ncbi:MAG: hypothetical protein AB8A42_08460 [Prochlorococcus sp.]